MKFLKTFAPLFILVSVLVGCGTTNTDNDDSNSSTIDLDFNGITIDKKDKYKSPDINVSGIFEAIDLGNWLVVGDYNQFGVEFKDSSSQDFTVEFANPDVCKYEKITVDGIVTHNLVGLKTGGTIFIIRDSEGTMVYRNVVNCRVAIDDSKAIFDFIARADYWQGEFYSKAGGGDFRFLVQPGDDGTFNKFTLSMREVGHDYGTVIFTVDLDSKKEAKFDMFHVYKFQCNVLTQAELIPVSFDVSPALDTIYISAKDGLIDFFRPVYLS